ncbi:MAG: hypothetical protein Q8R87_10070 [Anaerolineaceae bacterium]|jgi:hypothetical protein|nr:hypothetical protein [Anaerolineaceae bacterium]
MMEKKYWADWAQTLQQKRLTGLVVTLLEGAGPLKILISQALMGFLPLFGQTRDSSWHSFAQMLEDTAECRLFTTYLLEEKNT